MMKFKRHINVAVVMFWVLFLWKPDTGEVYSSLDVFRTKAHCEAGIIHMKKVWKDDTTGIMDGYGAFCAETSVPIHLKPPGTRR